MLQNNIALTNKTVLVTGVAGFIGSNLALNLLKNFEGVRVIGLDNMNNYYDPKLKEERLVNLSEFSNFSFIRGALEDKELIDSLFVKYQPAVVVNLAAQAGVRYSITNPSAYIESNIIGFFNILEACRNNSCVEHLVYASSSSVYGSNKKIPYSTDDKVDNPVSLYAATKKSNELMAHTYSKLYNIPTTGLRFFTVYGPAGRPDMAYFSFTNKLCKGETIEIFNYGNCKRDFTYVDDIVKSILLLRKTYPSQWAPIYNIGNCNPIQLTVLTDLLEKKLEKKGVYNYCPIQRGDIEETCADMTLFENQFGRQEFTPFEKGVDKFLKWYLEYYSEYGNKK